VHHVVGQERSGQPVVFNDQHPIGRAHSHEGASAALARDEAFLLEASRHLSQGERRYPELRREHGNARKLCPRREGAICNLTSKRLIDAEGAGPKLIHLHGILQKLLWNLLLAKYTELRSICKRQAHCGGFQACRTIECIARKLEALRIALLSP
jgi:hypothetical protein